MTEPIVHRNSGVPVADIARAVVAELAPQELDLFADVASAWAAGDVTRTGAGGSAGWPGGTIGWGLDPQLISLLIFPVLAGAIGQVVGSAGDRGLRRLWRRRTRRPEPMMSAELLHRAAEVRTACLIEALTVGVSRSRAELLADAVYGAMLRAIAEGHR